MKQLFFSLALLVSGAAMAQVQGKASEVPPMKEGKVTYERVTQMRRPVNLDAELADRFPKSRTEVFELMFSSDKTLYRPAPQSDNGDMTVSAPGGGMIMMRGGGSPNDETFTNLGDRSRVDKREFFGKEYVVADTLKALPWKFADDTKVILGKTARKAYAQRIGTRMAVSLENGEMKRTPVADTSTIVAWYTTEVPVAAGPAEFQGQLPGLILEVDVNNGRTVYRAVELSPKVSVAGIKEPKGKRMNTAEFEKARDTQMAEFSKNAPPGGNFQVRMQN